MESILLYLVCIEVYIVLSMSEQPTGKTVLIVEDEESLLELYNTWLESEGYDTYTASTGNEAMSLIESDDELGLDAAILDRRVPNYTGDEILEELREEGIQCGVAMVTAVDPDYDVLDLGFDTYAEKPVDKEELLNVVGRLVRTQSYNSESKKLLSLVSKKRSLEDSKSDEELGQSEKYEALTEDISELQSSLSEEAREDALIGFLLQMTGNNLLLSIQYTPDDWSFRYINPSRSSSFTELVDEDNMDELVDVFRKNMELNSDRPDSEFTGEHYVTLELFESIVYIHFYHKDGNGIVFGFDLNSVSNLTGFVSDIAPYLQDTKYFETENSELVWDK